MLKKSRFQFLLILVIAGLALICCEHSSGKGVVIDYPPDNQPNEWRIALGRFLFSDTRLSLDSSISCATCHRSELAFTDGLPKSLGIKGNEALRNAPTLLNIGYAHQWMFDGAVPSLEMLAIVPIQDSHEMGNTMSEAVQRLQKDSYLGRLSRLAYNRPLDAWVLTRSLAAYVRSLQSFNSAFDRFLSGDTAAISKSAYEGWLLFSGRLNCVACHTPPMFTSFNLEVNGLTIDTLDLGRFRIDGLSENKGRFKVPTLRNSVVTAPYMHNGSYPDLDSVLKAYSKGGMHLENQSELVKPFFLNSNELEYLKAFLSSLTDSTFQCLEVEPF